MRRLLAAAVVALVVACGAPPAATPSNPTSPLAEGEVLVAVVGTPVLQDDGSIELCPSGWSSKCAGILLDGEIPPELIADESSSSVVRVTGWYDGRLLRQSAPAEKIDYDPYGSTDFSSLCPELQGSPRVNPDDTLTNALFAYSESQPDYAVMWWDRESAVMTLWFKGDDVSAHQEAIAAVAGGEPVCVAGGARYSEAELMEASQRLQDFRDSRGRPLLSYGYSVGGLENSIEIPVEELDPETRARMADAFGEMVRPFPFIEMLEGSLVDLPDHVLAVPGNVEILTSKTRSGGGMLALGFFVVRYDADLNCVYFDGSESGDQGRTVPVWPFGYSATSSPLAVFDFDGALVASEGDTLELGGGFVDSKFIEGNTCGADSAWIINR